MASSDRHLFLMLTGLLGLGCLFLLVREVVTSPAQLVAGIFCLLLALCSLASFHIFHRLPSDSTYSFRTVCILYIIKLAIKVAGYFYQHRVECETKHCAKVQEKFLLGLLSQNKDTDYGRKYDFANIRKVEDYRKNIPLAQYTDIKKYIDRIADGEKNVTTVSDPVFMAATSGTSTGTKNVFPVVAEQTNAFLRRGVFIYLSLLQRHFQGFNDIRKVLRISYCPQWGKTKGGLVIGPVSATPGNKFSQLGVLVASTPPQAFTEISTIPELCYIHWLFALKDRDLGGIISTFSSITYNAFAYLESHWRELVHDIQTGSINKNVKITKPVREMLLHQLDADPERAKEIRKEFNKGFVGIAKRLWHHCDVIMTVDSGAFSLHGSVLTNGYCRGIPIYSHGYMSTEGMLAVNLWPEREERWYLPALGSLFLEFLPEADIDKPSPRTYLAHQVELGGRYEVVVTTVNGLYRFRIGDIVEVVNFHNHAPVLKFLFRIGQLLNLSGEKTSEVSIFEALTTTVRSWPGAVLINYACAVSPLLQEATGKKDNKRPHYVIFVEVKIKSMDPSVVGQKSELMDSNLSEVYPLYGDHRKNGLIDGTELRVVKPGTFDEFHLHLVSKLGIDGTQVKLPKCLKRKTDVKFLLDHVI